MPGIPWQYLDGTWYPFFMQMNPDTTEYDQRIHLTLKLIPTLAWVTSLSCEISETFIPLHSRMWARSYRRCSSLWKQQLGDQVGFPTLTERDPAACAEASESRYTLIIKWAQTPREQTPIHVPMGIWGPFLPLNYRWYEMSWKWYEKSLISKSFMYQDKKYFIVAASSWTHIPSCS